MAERDKIPEISGLRTHWVLQTFFKTVVDSPLNFEKRFINPSSKMQMMNLEIRKRSLVSDFKVDTGLNAS